MINTPSRSFINMNCSVARLFSPQNIVSEGRPIVVLLMIKAYCARYYFSVLSLLDSMYGAYPRVSGIEFLARPVKFVG